MPSGEACFERARKIGTQPEAVQLALGIALRESGNLDRSRMELAAALQAKPEWPAAQYQMAETLATLYQLGDRLSDAAEVLQEACRKYPTSAQAQFRLGMHLALVREYDQAIEVLHRTRQMAPADPRIQKAISLTEERRGNRALAISEAQRLLELVPDSTEDQFYLASLLQDDGQKQAATQLLGRVIESAPRHVGALNNLAQLRCTHNWGARRRPSSNWTWRCEAARRSTKEQRRKSW